MGIKIDPKRLGSELAKRGRISRKAVERGIQRGMARGRALLVKETPVDVGQMRNAWRVDKDLGIINDAPHAGVIEGGARPHKVNAAGRRALEQWAMRQLGVDEKTAKAVAQGTINKLAKQGQKGHFIVRDNMPRLQRMVAQEVERKLKSQAGKR